jgi:hypothetical protein
MYAVPTPHKPNGKRRRDGCLPDTAFAHDHDEAVSGCGEFIHQIVEVS